MKNLPAFLLLTGLVAAALFGGNIRASAAEKPVDKPAAAPVVPQSAFADDGLAGKDPFFPNSTRRQERTIVRVTPTTKTAPTVNFLNNLLLKGISGLDGQKLALINSSTVAQGEVAEIRLAGQILKIRCREIRERSVVVELESGSEVRELKLREGI